MIIRPTPHNKARVHPDGDKLIVSFSEEEIKEYSLEEVETLRADIQTLKDGIDQEMLAVREKARNIQEIETDLKMISRYIPEIRYRG